MQFSSKGAIGLTIARQDIDREYYFAYGSCMGDDLREDVPTFVRCGLAVLNGYRVAFSHKSLKRQGGVADIVRDASSVVEGVLYEFDTVYLAALDRREGVHSGVYRRIPVVVHSACGVVEAWAVEVVDKSEPEIAPHEDYADLVLKGAEPYVSSNYYDRLLGHIRALMSKS